MQKYWLRKHVTAPITGPLTRPEIRDLVRAEVFPITSEILVATGEFHEDLVSDPGWQALDDGPIISAAAVSYRDSSVREHAQPRESAAREEGWQRYEPIAYRPARANSEPTQPMHDPAANLGSMSPPYSESFSDTYWLKLSGSLLHILGILMLILSVLMGLAAVLALLATMQSPEPIVAAISFAFIAILLAAIGVFSNAMAEAIAIFIRWKEKSLDNNDSPT